LTRTGGGTRAPRDPPCGTAASPSRRFGRRYCGTEVVAPVPEGWCHRWRYRHTAPVPVQGRTGTGTGTGTPSGSQGRPPPFRYRRYRTGTGAQSYSCRYRRRSGPVPGMFCARGTGRPAWWPGRSTGASGGLTAEIVPVLRSVRQFRCVGRAGTRRAGSTGTGKGGAAEPVPVTATPVRRYRTVSSHGDEYHGGVRAGAPICMLPVI